MQKRLIFSMLMLLILSSLYGCGYNEMQYAEEDVNNAWGDVQSAYQRRADLIPNLVKIVERYAAHEKDTLTAVTEARAKVSTMQLSKEALSDPKALQNFQAMQGELSSALSRLMVVVEKYPDLKANENFLGLQNQVEGTENRINVARTRYNKAVATFNKSVRGFPNSMTNSLLLHLERKQAYEADAGAQKAPEINFK